MGSFTPTTETSLRMQKDGAEQGANGTSQSVPQIRKVCCIGAGYVGGPTCAVMANQVPHVDFTVVDVDEKRIAAWNSDDLPIFEPGLLEQVSSARGKTDSARRKNLFFSTDVVKAISEADLIFISVNTPTKVAGVGAGQACDLQYVELATRKVAEVATSDKIIVEKSTVPCRTADRIRDVLAANSKPDLRFQIVSNPEFLAEGTAIQNLLEPDRVLVGALPEDSAGARALIELYAQWVPRKRIITLNLWSSELSKIAANCMLAQRISSINSLSAVCEATGADIDEVAHTVGLDQRIGSKMLKASVGFGGSCFKKDIFSLVYLAESLHLSEVAAYWRSVVSINEWQKRRFTNRILSRMYDTLAGKQIAIFGFAYKKNTGDTRESSALSIARDLIAERAHLAIYDPGVREDQIWADLRRTCADTTSDLTKSARVCASPYEACQGAHAVVIITEWDEFRTGNANGVDWERIAKCMQRPPFVFDGRNVVDAAKLRALGMRVENIGNVGNTEI